MMRLTGKEYSKLLGIDIEESQIDKANEKYGSKKINLPFVISLRLYAMIFFRIILKMKEYQGLI